MENKDYFPRSFCYIHSVVYCNQGVSLFVPVEYVYTDTWLCQSFQMCTMYFGQLDYGNNVG